MAHMESGAATVGSSLAWAALMKLQAEQMVEVELAAAAMAVVAVSMTAEERAVVPKAT